MNGINESVLGDRVEEADEVVVGGVQGNICGGLGEVAVEMVPELWNGQLSWVLGIKVLKDNVEGAAGDAE